MRPNRIVLAAASLLVVAGSAHAQRVDDTRPTGHGRSYGRAPEVDVWIDRYVFRSGERIRAYFESEPGAYITILRVTTTGNVVVLYPRRPTAQRAYRDRLVNDEVTYGGRPEFYLNEPDGVGFVFAVASFEPFDYRAFNSGGLWSMSQLAGNRYGDPYRTVNSFVARSLSARAEYSTDYIQYEVISGGRYQRYGYGYGHESWYDDQYYRCQSIYGHQAIGYCRSYAGFGGFPYIVSRPPQSPAPVTPSKPARSRPKMAPPGRAVPDPVVTGGMGNTEQPSSSEQPPSSRYSGSRQRPSSPRVHPPIDANCCESTDLRRWPEPATQAAQPRSEPVPHVISQPRHEPAPVQRYESPRVQRHEPPAAPRAEPPRVEHRQETRPAPVQVREHPTPVPPPSPPLVP